MYEPAISYSVDVGEGGRGYGFYVKDATGKAIAQVWREAVAEQIVKGVNRETKDVS